MPVDYIYTADSSSNQIRESERSLQKDFMQIKKTSCKIKKTSCKTKKTSCKTENEFVITRLCDHGRHTGES